jgi:hypothetical protein
MKCGMNIAGKSLRPILEVADNGDECEDTLFFIRQTMLVV